MHDGLPALSEHFSDKMGVPAAAVVAYGRLSSSVMTEAPEKMMPYDAVAGLQTAEAQKQPARLRIRKDYRCSSSVYLLHHHFRDPSGSAESIVEHLANLAKILQTCPGNDVAEQL